MKDSPDPVQTIGKLVAELLPSYIGQEYEQDIIQRVHELFSEMAVVSGFDEHHEAPEGTYYNKVFPAPHFIKMAPPLADGSVEYMDGTEATLDQMARDVTEFLSWAGDPKMEVRKKTGFATMIYLFILSLLLLMTYKQVWKGQEH